MTPEALAYPSPDRNSPRRIDAAVAAAMAFDRAAYCAEHSGVHVFVFDG